MLTTKISLGIPKEIFYAYKNNRELSNLQTSLTKKLKYINKARRS